MNLKNLEIPHNYEELKKTYDKYYMEFYYEMVHISNTTLNESIDQFLTLLTLLSKSPMVQDVIRAAIGVTALHHFGYSDFPTLTRIFDRLIPQSDLEYVKFTSWCAGRLVQHPSLDQSRYVAHLLERLIGWIRAHGRRARHLAAVYMLDELSFNAGSDAVTFFEQLQSVMWVLVSHPSMQLIDGTAAAISMFTRAILRYRRNDLDFYLNFITQLCVRLLSFGNPIKIYAALKILEQILKSCPDYFQSKFSEYYDTIIDATFGGPVLVQSEAYVAITTLAHIDPKQFVELCVDPLLEQTEAVITEYPASITKALCEMIINIPEYMETRIQDLKFYADKLKTANPDCCFTFLTQCYRTFKDKFSPLNNSLLKSLAECPMTEPYNEFFITFTEIVGKNIPQFLPEQLCQRIMNEFQKNQSIASLELLGSLPKTAIVDNNKLMTMVSEKSLSENDDIRKAIPLAVYNLATATENQAYIKEMTSKLFQLAIFDPSTDVRCSILKVLKMNITHEYATSDALKFLQLFANDDSTTVRKLVFKAIQALSDFNPLYASNITRHVLLEHLYIIKNVPGIRFRARIIKTLPELIEASKETMKIYARPFMETAMDILTHPVDKSILDNFLEKSAADNIFMGILDSIRLVSPIAPEAVAEHSEQLLPLLCNNLVPTQERSIILTVLTLLYVLYSPPASVTEYRIMAPLVLQSCSKLLRQTQSRKIRMALLRVIGAIGVLEVHQRPPPKGSEAPKNVDESLSRLFFNPGRDIDNQIDDTLLLKPSTCEQCYITVVSSSLLSILSHEEYKDLYLDAVQALVEVLKNPKMYMLTSFDQFFSRFLDILEIASDYEMQSLLPYLSILIKESSHNSTPFVERTMRLIVSRFSDNLALPLLDIVLSFIHVLRDGFVPYATAAISLLVAALEAHKSKNVQISSKILDVFSQVGIYANDLLYLLVPQVSDTAINESVLIPVRIKALQTLETIAAQAELYMYLGPIVRALNYNLSTKLTTETREASLSLLSTVLKTQGSAFLQNSMPLIDYIRSIGLVTKDLEHLIETASNTEYFTPIVTAKAQQAHPEKKKVVQHPFAEEALVARATSPALGYRRHLEQWLHSFIVSCVSSSPNEAIRACTTLATSHYPFAMLIFKIAFFSCWQKISPSGRINIASAFHGLLIATENYESVVVHLLDLIFFMSKFECKMNIPVKDMASAALRYGFNAFALCLQQTAFQEGQINSDNVLSLIDIYVKLGYWDDAIAVWKRFSAQVPATLRQDLLVKLHMWDKVLPQYKQRFSKMNDPVSFSGLVKSYSNLAMWPEVIESYPNFTTLNRTQKRELTSYFGNAAYSLSSWDKLSDVLKTRPEDSIRCMLLQALSNIHDKNYDIDNLITNAWSVFASRPTTFWADNQTLQRDTMLTAQQIVEIVEIRDWAKNEALRPEIEKVWRRRLQTAPRDFEVWFKLILNREMITHIRDDLLIDLFQLKSRTLGTKINDNVFKAIFHDLDLKKSPDIDRICCVVNHWTLDHKAEALKEMKQLTETIKGPLRDKCNTYYATWLLSTNDNINTLLEAYAHLKQIPVIANLQNQERENKPRRKSSADSPEMRRIQRYSSVNGDLYLPTSIIKNLETDEHDVDVLRQWADINTELTGRDQQRTTRYVTNAIDALAVCCRISPLFTDVVQLLNIFFEHADQEDVFEQSKYCISQLSDDLLLQASSQLLVQLSHPSEKVAQFVHDIMLELLDEHYHGLIFSLIVNTFSKNIKRATASQKLYDEFSEKHPEESEEIILIRKCLLRAAVTWYEKCLQFITDAFDHYSMNRLDKMVTSLNSIVKMAKKPKCELHQQFLKQYGVQIQNLEQILRVFSPSNQNSINNISQWCRLMQNSVSEDIRKVHIIQLSSLSSQLGNMTHFKLAVPGTYKPGKPINRIQYFVGQFTVYMSKQQPKDVIIRGEDGNFYQYLVKGHEDLRLDERIMQFFRLINSFLKKETAFEGNIINTMSVIPLSVQHGLVSWVRGTDTLRALVEKYRQLYDRNSMEEYQLLEEFSYPNFDYMLPIQKQQVVQKVCHYVPDTDIAEFFRLKARSAETWLKQTRTFSISTAMTSIVGYIIGLGDRHPSNLLIDKITGKVIHIDFGDSFERAAKRKFLPEVVPFRLTRMMVRALGVSGVNGIFTTTFVNMSSVLRENKRVLVMVLSIFVHEPLVDPEELEAGKPSGPGSKKNIMPTTMMGSMMDKGRVMLADTSNQVQSSIEMRNRVNQKLSGTDFDNTVPLSVEDQAHLLIQMAINPYNLAKMYSGWCSFW